MTTDIYVVRTCTYKCRKLHSYWKILAWPHHCMKRGGGGVASSIGLTPPCFMEVIYQVRTVIDYVNFATDSSTVKLFWQCVIFCFYFYFFIYFFFTNFTNMQEIWIHSYKVWRSINILSHILPNIMYENDIHSWLQYCFLWIVNFLLSLRFSLTLISIDR